MMHRFYLQIYLTVVASLALFVLVAGLAWHQLAEVSPQRRALEIVTALADAALPAAAEPRATLQTAIERLHARVRADLALYAPDRSLLAAAGAPLPAPQRSGGGWNGGPVFAVTLPDGRLLAARLLGHDARHPALGLIVGLGLVALAVALGAFPAVRRLTRRLERLQASVEALGAGDLSARVNVEGRDEVSSLAQSFNRAAARIEQLVGAHKGLLANTSHELRSPLARIRMGIAMLNPDATPQLRAELEHNIAELDALIDEILLASRLDTVSDTEAREDIDLLALLAEECARVEATLEGAPVTVHGDRRLLRRLMRNLLENARRHGGGSPIEVGLRELADERVELRVCDRGPGVPETERARIFEPFYRPAGGRVREGSVGLGLSLVRQIAQHHGGDASYLARAGGGACLRVELSKRPAKTT
jgi:signal transduction histidine kinase